AAFLHQPVQGRDRGVNCGLTWSHGRYFLFPFRREGVASVRVPKEVKLLRPLPGPDPLVHDVDLRVAQEPLFQDPGGRATRLDTHDPVRQGRENSRFGATTCAHIKPRSEEHTSELQSRVDL